MERDDPVVAQLADRDPEPVGVPEHGDGVGGQVAELARPHAGPGQQLDHQPIAGQAVGLGCGQQLGGVLVGEELGQRLGPRRDVAVEDRVPSVGLGPVPLDEALEEDPDHPQPLALGVLGQGRALAAGLGGEPHLVVLDVGPGDVGHRRHVGLGHQPPGQLAQGGVGHVHAAGSEEGGELDQVAAHGGGQLRCLGRQHGPLPVGLVLRDPGLGQDFGDAHWATSTMASSSAAWASTAVMAWWYSLASQSLVRCR